MTFTAPDDPEGEVAKPSDVPMSLNFERVRRCTSCNTYLCTVDIYSDLVVEGSAIIRNIKCWKCGEKNNVKLIVKRPRD
jgi:hypothetical protein